MSAGTGGDIRFPGAGVRDTVSHSSWVLGTELKSSAEQYVLVAREPFLLPQDIAPGPLERSQMVHKADFLLSFPAVPFPSFPFSSLLFHLPSLSSSSLFSCSVSFSTHTSGLFIILIPGRRTWRGELACYPKGLARTHTRHRYSGETCPANCECAVRTECQGPQEPPKSTVFNVLLF